MIFRQIIIENFRSYYGVNTINFKDGLMIFIGDNGDGKTTFFEALEWLFDTTVKQNVDLRLISQKKLSELTDFETQYLRVTLKFEHDGEKIVEKSFAFSKSLDNNVKTFDYQFKGFEGIGYESSQIDGGFLLDRCFVPAIRKYCLFKGEDDLNVFNNPNALNFLVENFSDIRKFDPFYTDDPDNLGFTNFAEIQSRKAFEKAMRSDKQNTQQEKEISSNLDAYRKKLGDVKQQLRDHRLNASNYSSKLDSIENSKEDSDLLRNLNDRIKSLSQRKLQTEALINEEYAIGLLDNMWILCGYSAIFEEYQKRISSFSREKRKLEREEDKLKGKQELAKEIAEGIIPLSPNIPDRISMEEMIKEEFCKVCGRPAEKGSDAYNFMVNKLEHLVKSQQPKDLTDAKNLFPNSYLKELEQISNNLEYNLSDTNNLLNNIHDTLEFNNARKAEVYNISQSLSIEEENKKKLLAQNDGLTEDQLINAYHNIKNWWDSKNQSEKQIALLEKDENELQKKFDKFQEEYDNLAKTTVAAIYSKIYGSLQKVKNAFKNAKEKNTIDFLNLLEVKANEYLERLNVNDYRGIIRIIQTHDGSVKIVLEDKNRIFNSSPNQALKTTMYMSVLFAVSDLTTIRRENTYPLIFDAPTSSFSPQKEAEFFKVISGLNKQCLIFTKSFLTENGLLDKDKIDAQKCTIHRLEKLQPFNNLDLSTIQTRVTLVKN